ncbi:hypothetical protein [Desulfurispira natronophila]|uniref:Uncharacterized protein n=1 Tax=Desulfurispira natronophila TaxID=682562 RepID=A0A7W7Y2A5_9BACT|nr:hypothetical protein [Desulfurispira natronophila]MBB5020704.1 hypothetical protein [Desulfurispira natronophila]
MGKTLKYDDGRYAKILFESGDKIQISVVKTGVQIHTLRLFALVPDKLLGHWGGDDFMHFVELFAPGQPKHLIFQEAVNTLKTFGSPKEVAEYIEQNQIPVSEEDAGTT